MLRTKNTKSCAHEKLIITFYNSQVYQTLYRFSNHWFQAFRAVKLIQQIAAKLNCGCFKGSTFFYTPCSDNLTALNASNKKHKVLCTREIYNNYYNSIIPKSIRPYTVFRIIVVFAFCFLCFCLLFSTGCTIKTQTIENDLLCNLNDLQSWTKTMWTVAFDQLFKLKCKIYRSFFYPPVPLNNVVF